MRVVVLEHIRWLSLASLTVLIAFGKRLFPLVGRGDSALGEDVALSDASLASFGRGFAGMLAVVAFDEVRAS
jgi:hypothetical protein